MADTVPVPTPRPPFGADDTEFSTRTNGPLQTGHMNDKTGEVVMDAEPAEWRMKIERAGKSADPKNYRR